eukprot:scaffold408_cov347-Pavlova_lutheri.AAC.8
MSRMREESKKKIRIHDRRVFKIAGCVRGQEHVRHASPLGRVRVEGDGHSSCGPLDPISLVDAS